MDSSDHAAEQIDGLPNKTVESTQHEKTCVSSPLLDSREDTEEASESLKHNWGEGAKHYHVESTVIDLRQDSPIKQGCVRKGKEDEYSKMSLNIIDNGEGGATPSPVKVTFRTNRDSPTPEMVCSLNSRKQANPELDNHGGIMDSTLFGKSNLRKGTKTVRPTVFERLARTETVAFRHQKFKPLVRSRSNRSTSAPPLLQRGIVRKISTKTGPGKIRSTKDTSPTPTRYSLTKPTKPRPSQRIPRRKSSFSLPKLKNGPRPLLSSSGVKKNILTRAIIHGDLRREDNVRNKGRKVQRPLRVNKFKSNLEAFHTTSQKSTLGDSFYSRRRSVDDESIDSYDMHDNGPPLYIEFSNRTKIICSNKYAPELGFEDIDPQLLGIRRSLTEYEAGSLSAKKLASEIMHALLWRDLPSRLKWNVNFPLERELAMPIGELGYSFFIEATEMKDDSDTSDDEDEPFHTASATGNVSFLPDRWEVHIENYSCVHNVDEKNLGNGVDV